MSVFSRSSSDDFSDTPSAISSPLKAIALCRSQTLSDEIAAKEAQLKNSQTDEFKAWFNVYLILEKKAGLTIAERTYAREITDIPGIKKAIAHCENIIAYRESEITALIEQARDGTSPNISAEGGEFY